MTVISRDNDESLIEDTKLLELVDGSLNGVVKLKKIAKSPVVVESVHLLIDGSSLAHEEETLVTTTVVENLNSLDGHLLKAGKVKSGGISAEGVVLESLEVLGVDVAVEPDGEVALAEDAEGLLLGVGGEEGGLVEGDGVALVGELLVVVLALVGALAGVELLGTTAEVDVGAVHGSPGVVGNTVESLVDDGTVEGTLAGVGGEGGGSGIREGSSGDGTPGRSLCELMSMRRIGMGEGTEDERIAIDLPRYG